MPRIGLGGQPGFEDLVGAAWYHVQESGGAAALLDGRQVQDDGDVFDSVGGIAPYVFIHADETHAFKPGRVVVISERSPSVRTAVLAALPGHTEGLGDARHRQMVDDQSRERPAHRRTRELGRVQLSVYPSFCLKGLMHDE